MTFVTCLLLCCTTITAPDSQWTDNDKAALKAARAHCSVYFPKSPCLTKLKKIETYNFHAYCGKDNK